MQRESGERIEIRVNEALRGLIPRFLQRRRDDVHELMTALEKSDFVTMRTLGHRMSGNGRSMGFDNISTIGAAIEHAADTQDSATIAEQTTALQTYLDQIDVVYG